MLLDCCLKQQSPCDDVLAIDPALLSSWVTHHVHWHSCSLRLCCSGHPQTDLQPGEPSFSFYILLLSVTLSRGWMSRRKAAWKEIMAVCLECVTKAHTDIFNLSLQAVVATRLQAATMVANHFCVTAPSGISCCTHLHHSKVIWDTVSNISRILHSLDFVQFTDESNTFI